jgi:VIT1/CCC1 family predicted Fe2+/Mn2+ transporter
MYLMAAFMDRARLFVTLDAIRIRSPEAAHRFVVDMLPSALSSALTAADIETLRQRMNQRALPSTGVTLARADFLGAAGVFLLVSLSTFPVVVPLMVIGQQRLALRVSNAVAVLMMFILGALLGRYAGRPGWRTGLGMVGVGLVLVAVTMALGG